MMMTMIIFTVISRIFVSLSSNVLLMSDWTAEIWLIGVDDVGDDNSWNLHDDLLLLSVAHPCLFSSSVREPVIYVLAEFVR